MFVLCSEARHHYREASHPPNAFVFIPQRFAVENRRDSLRPGNIFIESKAQECERTLNNASTSAVDFTLVHSSL